MARQRLRHNNLTRMLRYQLMREGILCAKNYYYKTYFESQLDRNFQNELPLLQHYRPMQSGELLNIALQLLSAVHYLLINGVAHKQISPQTVERKGNAVVLKFFFETALDFAAEKQKLESGEG